MSSNVVSSDAVSPDPELSADLESTAPSPAARLLAGLDDDQRAAVCAPAGPVCILAGAGTGKTRAITHRIAHRVMTGQTAPQHVLAVTFTARAAGELRGRLRQLGAHGVQARTFHAAALRQLRYFAPRVFNGRSAPELLEGKIRLVAKAASGLKLGLERTALRDVTSDIEWAKSSLVEPEEYPAAAQKHHRSSALPLAQIVAIYTAYEQAKRAAGVIDFEDVLRATVWAIEEHSDVAEQVRSQYRHFVVDEYQDVNPLQQCLLHAWLGGRGDVCVVGDASQTIYSFTGASPSYLVDFARTHPGATVVALQHDYRSTPQVVELANQVIAAATGEQSRLRLQLEGQRPAGPLPKAHVFDDEPAEAAAVAKRCTQLIAAGTPAAEIAVLFRTNAQSQAYEQALASAGVPYMVQGAERFFERPEIREAMVLLRGASRAANPDDIDASTGESVTLQTAVSEVLSATGFEQSAPPAGGAGRERWEALAALLRLAGEFAVGNPQAGLGDFVAELAERAAVQHAPTVDGVTVASLHAAKGLEWDAVFLVGAADGTLPISYATSPEQIEEERRLCYVGITRAREQLWVSWAASRSPGGRASRRPSRFLPDALLARSGVGGAAKSAAGGRGSGGKASGGAAGGEAGGSARKLPQCRSCGVALFDPKQRKLRRCSGCPASYDEELFERLRAWRLGVAAAQEVPAYV
ncbi:MAG: ATP-dependent helicase, partial [Mycobacteriales bacterium]